MVKLLWVPAFLGFFSVEGLVAQNSLKSKPISYQNLPYIADSLDNSDRKKFNQKLKSALKNIDSLTSQSIVELKSLNPKEKLAVVYQVYLLETAYEKLGQFKKADSLLADILNKLKSSHWKKHFVKKRWKLNANNQNLDKWPNELLTEFLKYDMGDSIKIGIYLQLLKRNNFSGKPGSQDDLIKKIFRMDALDHRLLQIYDTISKYSQPGQRSAELELILARYEAKKGKWEPAIKRCFSIPAKTTDKKILKSMRVFHPLLHFRKGKYMKAAGYYKKYLGLYGNHPQVLLQIARCYRNSGNKVTANIWYDKFRKAYPNHSKSEEIMWSKGWNAEERGQFTSAVKWYKELIPKFPKSKRGLWANFRIGYTSFKAKNYKQALEYFKKGYNQDVGYMSKPACHFWIGKTLEAQGNKKQALVHFSKTYKIYPYHYYGHAAFNYVKEKKLDSANKLEKFIIKDLPKDSLSHWLGTFFEPAAFDLKDGNSSYLSIAQLQKMGLDTLALLTFEAIYKKNKNNPKFLFFYSKLFQKKWETRSYQLARRLGYQVPDTLWSEVPRLILNLIYPNYFESHVRKYSKENQLFTGFVFALMKQESGFMEKVTSRAGAIGLMQIMPATGKNLAKEINLNNFKVTDLRQASTNIKLGTVYMKKLTDRYNGNLMLVLGNYNAGPRPTNRWNKTHGKKPKEIFVEEVDYWETRDYIKKVMGNYWTYQQLYP